MTTDLTLERLRALLRYDPGTGLFWWKQRTSARCSLIAPAGHVDARGYVWISVDRKRYYAHRLAWLWVHGEWPAALIDHLNGSKSDNRSVNLREASKQVNAQNIQGAPKNSTSQLLGACFDKRRGTWYTLIRVGGSRKHFGPFPTPQAAHEAHIAAKRLHHEGNTL